MDDTFQELEAELRGMVPMAPSRRLQAAITNELSAPRRRARYLWWALPLAAAVALAAGLWSANRRDARRELARAVATAKTPVEAFRPVGAENVLLRSEEEGFLTLADGTPARQIRVSYLDTITWKNPKTNASLKWTLPREEIRVVPVSYQ